VLLASVYSLWLEIVIRSTWEYLWWAVEEKRCGACTSEWPDLSVKYMHITYTTREIKTHYKDQETEGRLTGLVTSSAGTAFQNTLFKERYKGK